MTKESGFFKDIISKLDRLEKKENTLKFLIGIQTTIIYTVLTWISFSFIEMLGHFSSGIRTFLFIIFVLISSALFIVLFLIPFLKSLKLFGSADYYKSAGKVGLHFPSVKDDLLNSLQLISNDKDKQIFSINLIDAAFKNIFERTKEIDFSSIIDFSKTKKLTYYLSGTLIFGLLCVFFIPGIGNASFRIINFNMNFISPPRFVLQVSPGNFEVTKGEKIKIIVRAAGEKPNKVFLAIKNSDDTRFDIQPLYADSAGGFYYDIPAVRNSFKYYATAEDIKSNIYSVNVIDRPIIKTMELRITSPTYSHIPVAVQKDNGNISALTGSTVSIDLSSTQQLAKAHLEFGDSTKKELTVNYKGASGKFSVNKDGNYRIILLDKNGNTNLSPIVYSVKSLPDAYPSIEIISPNQNVSLANDNRLSLDTKISDDFGFSKLQLHFRLSQSKYEKIQNDFKSIDIPVDRDTTQQEVRYVWNLTGMNLTAEDVVTYYLEIYDNDIISGPKSAKSNSFTVRIPTLDEILNKTNDMQTKSLNDLEETFKKADELKQKIADLSQELKQDKKDITWQEKQKIEQAQNEFKKLQEKMSDISKNMEQMQQDLQKNNLLSRETLEKYTELQNLFREMSNDEMRKAMEQLQNVLQNMDRKLTQNSLQNMQFNEDQFRKSIERTMNLLKRIQVEQNLDDLLKRTEQISKNQNEIKNESGKVNASQTNDELSEKQNDITKDLDKFSKQLADIQKKFEELKDLPKDQLDKLRKEFEQQKNDQMSQQASEDMKQNQMNRAQNNQSMISQNMQKMNKGIQQLQQSMAQENQVKTFKDMMKITDNLITLSKQQEQLNKETNNTDQSTSSFNNNAQDQNDIQNNLDKIMQQLSHLSQKTFAITPEMGKSLGDAERQMSQSIQSLQNRNNRSASEYQEQAMQSLNQAASLMKSSMDQMMQGGQGGGMPSLMQQLRQLSGQQMNLNNLTQMLQQAMKGKLSMQQQAEMQRLAQQQELIRKSMEQLNKEAMNAGESKKIPANLNDIAKSMEEVVKNLSTNDIDENVLQKQEHILSRMLDAQRSVNERDYEKQRESKSGSDIARKSPADLNLSEDKSLKGIRDELNRAVKEGYSKDYQNLIEKYFEALQKQQSKNSAQ